MRFATLATACVVALTSVNAQAIDQAYIGVSPSLFSSLLPSIEVSRWSSKVEVSIVMGIAADCIEFLSMCASRFRSDVSFDRASRRPLNRPFDLDLDRIHSRPRSTILHLLFTFRARYPTISRPSLSRLPWKSTLFLILFLILAFDPAFNANSKSSPP
jgi:hypothetical protein